MDKTMISFSREQRMVHHLMLHSRDCSDYGLFTGRLGIALVLEEYAVQHRSKPIRHLAETLAAEVFNSRFINRPRIIRRGCLW